MGAFLRDIRIISLLMCIRQTYSDGSILNIFKNSPGQNLQIKFGPMGLDLSLQRLRCGKNKTNLAVILVLNLEPELGKDRVYILKKRSSKMLVCISWALISTPGNILYYWWEIQINPTTQII